MTASGRARNSALAITALCSVQFVDVLGVTVVVTALPAMATGLAMIAMADAALTAAAHGWALSACGTTAGTGLGLSSVAATTLGTTVPDTLRGTASGIINTAAQLGTATGIALVLLIAAATTSLPAPGGGAPITAWAAAAAIAAAGTLAFSTGTPTVTSRPPRPPTRGHLPGLAANADPVTESASRPVLVPPRATPSGEQDADDPRRPD